MRLLSQSSNVYAPPSTRNTAAPDMSHRTPSEQAVIQALQAVANYAESRGNQRLIDTPTQP